MELTIKKTLTFTLTITSSEIINLNAKGCQTLIQEIQEIPELPNFDNFTHLCFEIKPSQDCKHEFIVTEAAKAIARRNEGS